MQIDTTIISWNLATVAAMMIGGWLISLIYRNVTIVDSLWGLGFVLIAWLTFFASGGYWGRGILIAVLTTIWGLRLCLYLSWRNWGKGEDPRYGSWREKSGKRGLRRCRKGTSTTGPGHRNTQVIGRIRDKSNILGG